jgi:hypothetical protein
MKQRTIIIALVAVALTAICSRCWYLSFLNGNVIASATDDHWRCVIRELPDNTNPLLTDGHVYSLEIYDRWVLEAVTVCRSDSFIVQHQKCKAAIKRDNKFEFDLEGDLVRCELKTSGERGWIAYEWKYPDRNALNHH